MSDSPQTLQRFLELRLKVYPGSTLVIRLLLDSQITENLLFRPTLDDWTVENGEIISLSYKINPPYLYLMWGSKVSQTITFSIPLFLQPGMRLNSWLRFPAIQEEAIPIQLEILSPLTTAKPSAIEVALPVTLPFTSPEENATLAGSFSLMSGLMDLDKIPSRWLASELLTILCQTGQEYACTEPGKQLLHQIKATCLFKNGSDALASAQIPNWIADSFKSANTILGGYTLLNVWEQVLFSLVPGKNSQKTSVPVFSAENFVAKLGGSAERWFAGILLGLAQISPQIASKLKALNRAEVSVLTSNLESDRATEATKTLVAGLPSLDTLPVRWLVVELLIRLCQQGDEYARTQAGSQLLAQLKSTDFFKNGVLAFAAAAFPRWLTISQQAASAYQASVGAQMGQGGLLDLGQQWLWNLTPTDLTDRLKDEISLSSAAADAFVISLGMDAERWFSCIVLGLALVSPRIEGRLHAIASNQNNAHHCSKSFKQTRLDDVLQEGRSLQR